MSLPSFFLSHIFLFGYNNIHLFPHTYRVSENSEFKPVKLRLKIDLVSYPARAEGLVNSK